MERACTYKFAAGAYINLVSSDALKFFAFQLMMATPEYKGHDIYKDSMYIYSLLIWGNIARDKQYDDANRFLLALWKKYVDTGKAEMVTDGWRYMIAREDTCLGETVQMIAVKEDAPVNPGDFLGVASELCN